ncbi:conserved hypothetical protein [Culex quinquefasciatus]|uniref:Uncharacterized protein n=1 Tax=Culex quinquefasciatus TaxID=7176 RepID=B0XI86_CULQU|nr:conserved hypothetical protein [Culex quinquefasciatus]|eukprot:XP_001869359.1 conserved hypothetical protein [Culex quinquefasciatus]
MIGRADIEGSKSHVAMNAWRPQASYPCAVPVLNWLFIDDCSGHGTAGPGRREPPGATSAHRTHALRQSTREGTRARVIPAFRANPYPEVTDLICRLPLPTLIYRLETLNLGDCCGFAPVLLTKTWPTKHTDILYVDRHGPKGKGRPDVRTVAMTSCKNVMTGPEGTSILSLPIDSPSPWWRWERRASPETVYAGIHHAPGCTPRTGKPQVAAQAFRTERRYCGTSNQMPRGRCRACSHRWLTVS